MTQQRPAVAYFSMEIALAPSIPTYSGGLGVLAGDTLRSAADLGAPLVAVTLLHRQGYFRQSLDDDGRQTESPAGWRPEELLEPVDARACVMIEGRSTVLRAWLYRITGVQGHSVSVYLLDSDLDENAEQDRALTRNLYGGDARYRLCQEAVLGVGGVRMLRALGHAHLHVFHMNEGHSALLTLELLEERAGARGVAEASEQDAAAVRSQCVFTTHTPVPAGHDRFPRELAQSVVGESRMKALAALGAFQDGELNMTYLALRASHFVNGVAMKHGEVSAGMFPNYPVSAITNGVHAATWASEPFRNLFDLRIPQWRYDNNYLRYAVGIPLSEIRSAHALAKRALLDRIREATDVPLDPEALTIGFARRAASYKRADLVFSDLDRLTSIARGVGPLQFVFGGKAHPNDYDGKQLIQRVVAAGKKLGDAVKVVYLEDYDMQWAAHFVSGVDIWLNTPQRPQEASGTSGMKAALNGVPSFSVLDGWWIEGCIEGRTGWSIDGGRDGVSQPAEESSSLYHKLETEIAPTYYGRSHSWTEVMRAAIAINGSYFNTERMVLQYLGNAYYPGARISKRVQDWN